MCYPDLIDVYFPGLLSEDYQDLKKIRMARGLELSESSRRG